MKKGERRPEDRSKARYLDGPVKPKNKGDGGKHRIDTASTALRQPTLQCSYLETPWTEEPGGLQCLGRRESDMTEWLHFHWRHSLITGHRLSSLE